MKKRNLIVGAFLLMQTVVSAQCNSSTIFDEEDDNAVCIEVTGNVRYVYANSIPDHAAGGLNGGFTVTGQDDTWTMCAYPTLGASVTQLYGDDEAAGCSTAGSYRFGVGTNGVHYAPSSREYFEILDSDTGVATGEYNYDWNVEAVEAFGMNSQGAHLNAKGEYHYHSIATDYFTKTTGVSLGIDGTSFSPIVAYAADGYPVYYKYAYTNANDANSGISSFDSGWQLKTDNGGVRSGDGFSAPNGAYDGYYVEDYEFNAAATQLDECNGRYGVTPDYPDGTYYYVLTDSWPYIPRCFAGAHVDESFLIGPSNVCPDSTADTNCSASTLSLGSGVLKGFFTVEPNPVITYFEIKLPEEYQNKPYQITLYNSLGKQIESKQNLKKYDASTLSAGIYYLTLQIEDLEIMKKLIVLGK